jgi:UDPglucose--hexose-1-phosphate uridylyltransferase
MAEKATGEMTERRFDPTTGEWVSFATHRQNRSFLPARPDCPLCADRAGAGPSEVDRPAYEVVVFDNRSPGFLPEPPAPAVDGSDLYPVEPSWGRSEVVVFSDRHDATLSDLGVDRLRLLVDVWADRYAILGAEPHVRYVLAFENKGEVIGVTLHHPHGQIYAYPEVPPRPLAQLAAAHRYRQRTGRHVWADVVADVGRDRRRLVADGSHFVVQVPFAARFPYEVQIIAKTHLPSLLALDAGGRDDLARLLQMTVRAYDGLFGFSLPYVMAVYARPTSGAPAWGGDWDDVSWLWVDFMPPHREATKLKYLAGSELAGGAFISDVAPEDAAEQLRAAWPTE